MSDVGPKLEQARAHFMAGRHEQARQLLERALRASPGQPELCNAMGLVLGGMGKLDLAIYHAERAAKGRPQDAGYWNNYGNVLARAGRNPEARRAFERSIGLNPGDAAARLGLSNVLRTTIEFSLAAEHLVEAARANPGDPDVSTHLSFLLLKLARVEEAVAEARRGQGLNPGHLEVAAALAHASNYMPGLSRGDIVAAHAEYGRILQEQHPVRGELKNARDPGKRVKVGLLSYDLRQHPVGLFIEPVLRHRDRTKLEMVCYSTCPKEDAHSATLKGLADGWKNVAEKSDAEVADSIRIDGVDVLIELSGLTSFHRLGVMAMRPAPVQATFCGYPSTTGLTRIGYRLVDSITDPEESAAIEKLVRVDPSFLCYPGPSETAAPTPPGQGRPITFGSFNSAPKINREVVAAWARILKAVPRSRLLLKALEFQDVPMREGMLRRFEAEGMEPERVEIVMQTASFAEHLGMYGQVDVGLDPFPYNGTTTTFEALWMGVPVVTLRGETHAGRVGTSILTNAGLEELIAGSVDEYVEGAVRLAGDTEKRAGWRGALRERVRGSPLCDGEVYGGRVSEAIVGMWREWAGGG